MCAGFLVPVTSDFASAKSVALDTLVSPYAEPVTATARSDATTLDEGEVEIDELADSVSARQATDSFSSADGQIEQNKTKIKRSSTTEQNRLQSRIDYRAESIRAESITEQNRLQSRIDYRAESITEQKRID